MHELMEMPTTSSSQKLDPRRPLLMGIFRALNSSGAPWCIVHGYENFDEPIPADIDCLLGRDLNPRRLAELLKSLIEREECHLGLCRFSVLVIFVSG